MKKVMALIVASVLVFSVVALTACGGKNEPKPEGSGTEAGSGTETGSGSVVPGPAPGIVGGWTIDELAVSGAQLPDEVKEAFEKAMTEYVGMDFKPIAYLGSQVVSGSNYMILCEGTMVTAEPTTELDVVTIYKDLNGNAEITNVAPLDLGAIENTENANADTQQLMGGWTPQFTGSSEVPAEIKKVFEGALEGLVGVGYEDEVCLATKVVSGIEYAFLTKATTVTAEPASYHAIIFATANADGTYSIANIVPLNLTDFTKQ